MIDDGDRAVERRQRQVVLRVAQALVVVVALVADAQRRAPRHGAIEADVPLRGGRHLEIRVRQRQRDAAGLRTGHEHEAERRIRDIEDVRQRGGRG